MKFIHKGSAPEEYARWCASGNAAWQPSFKELGSPRKDRVKTELIREQGGICCYCEQRLEMDDSHVEHVRPQHLPEVDSLDFANMACSCQDQVKKGEPRHCGNLKLGWFEETLFVSPFDRGCEQAFAFTGDGRILAARVDDAAAERTIKKLGLDIPKLNDMRSKALEPFLDPEISHSDIQDFADGYLEQTREGGNNPFWTTIAFLFAPKRLAAS